MIKNKKAGIEHVTEIVAAIILLMIAWLFIQIAVNAGAIPSAKVNVFIDSYTSSKVCNTDLLNFLRATDATGMSYSQQLALAQLSSESKDAFNVSAQEFWKNYQRGNWKLIASSGSVTIASLGELEKIDIKDSCIQYIPSLSPGENIEVKLFTEY